MTTTCTARRYKHGVWETLEDTVSREEPVHIVWEGAGLSGSAALWAWPGPDSSALQELAAGHVLLHHTPEPYALRAEVKETPCAPGEHRFSVRLMPGGPYGTACRSSAPPSPDDVLTRMDTFMTLPGLWDGTGCFHRAAVWLPDAWAGESRPFVAEDIGRHNCLDRLMGHAAARQIALRGQTLFISARITASLYAKARKIGFGHIVSRAAVSLQAIQTAKSDGITLIGFCRPKEGRFTVYT